MRFELKVSTIVLVVLLGTSHGCLEHERNALLQLFPYFKINSSTIANTPNCCDWSWDGFDGTEGNTANSSDYSLQIQCNDTEGRVTHLYLLSGKYRHGKKADLYLNTSLFLPFKGLRTLQLWNLGIVGCSENEGFQRLSILENLESLSLYNNLFDSSIFTSQGLCELWHLRYLDLSRNDLSGSLPWCLANMTSLQGLELYSNQISGDIDFSPIKSLTSLQDLEISGNRFKVPISLAPFFNHSKLKSLYVGGNELYAQTEVKNLSPKFQLETLLMSGPVRNAAYPEFLYHQYSLQDVDLSDIQIMGEFPYWLLENNTDLGWLNLHNNSLSGELQLPIHPHRSLFILVISMNSIHGPIPDSLSHLSNLRTLDISDNNLSGSIPTGIGSLSSLRALDLSENSLSGPLPPNVCSPFSSLKVLDLSENSLSGPLPPNFCSPSMNHLKLSNNKLFGSLTEVFCDCSNLTTLDLSYNRFTGSIPDWIRRCSQLEFLLLSHNDLQGKIPVQLCSLDQLNLIDLSHNNLSGHILPCLMSRSNSNIRKENDLDILGNQPHLEFTEKFLYLSYGASILEYISAIDLYCNNLTGEIPPEIGNLSGIHVLNLSHNSLKGPIPLMFVNLKQIESLDISYNKLYGEIPSQLTELNFLAVFSVAHNRLSGRTPERAGQFATFDESSYEGNPLLCGMPLPKRCYERMPRTSTEEESEEDNGFMDMEAFYVSFLVSYIMVLLVIVAVLYINPYWRSLLFAFIDATTTKFYYFLLDNLQLLSKFGLS